MRTVLQRRDWYGEPIKQGETFRLTKGSRIAECELWSHPLGWELRLVAAGELVRSQVCQSQDDVLTRTEQWKAGMLAKGWR